ncbi:hypothetical protein [Ottowia sp.]|uniref:hypothetical protein n=2 Tax=Ottowia sp. TaxID=1898956 RepID=UPI002CC1C9DE|nr:hypothetical protein [Ottowia sp.]HPZ56840.1 hypothetical protein [Ottowia sp.]
MKSLQRLPAPFAWFSQRAFFRSIVLFAVFGVVVGSAHGAVNSFVFGMRASGTAPFDAGSGPGLDAGAGDNVVRTFDVVSYVAGYTFSQADTAVLLTVKMGAATLPSNYVGPSNPQIAYFSLADLPTGLNGCSNIQSTPLASPPAAGVSGVSADGQTIYCYQPGPTSGSNMDFKYRVSGAAPNGTVIQPPSLTLQSAHNTASTPTPLNGTYGADTFYGLPPLSVSAAPRWKVAKTPAANGAVFIPKSGPNGEDGYIASFNIGIYAQGSRKGLEALQPNFTLADNFSNPATNANGGMPNAQLVTWDVIVPYFASMPMGPSNQKGCGDWRNQLGRVGNYSDNGYAVVNDTGNTASTAANAGYTVAKGGDCVAAAPAGQSSTLTVSGTDFSLAQYPRWAGYAVASAGVLVDSNNLDASSNQWWVASKSVLFWVPPSDLTPNVQEFLNNTVDLHGTSVTGQDNPPSSGTGKAGITRMTGVGFSKVYSAGGSYRVLPASINAAACDPNITGDCHVNQATPGQIVSSRLLGRNLGADDFPAGYLCDRIDNTRMTFADLRSYATGGTNVVKDPATGILKFLESGNPSVLQLTYELGVGGTGTTGGTWNNYNTVSNEYASLPATTGSTQSDSGCADSDATWYPSIDALLAAGHTLAEVTRVRASYSSFPAAYAVQVHIPLQVNAQYSYSSTDQAPGASFTQGTSTLGAFAPNQAMWNRVFNGSPTVYKAADSLRITQTEYARITKTALAPYNLNTGQVSRGALVTYNLQVNLTSSTNAHIAPTVIVWDVIPQYTSYIPGSSTFGGAPLADPVCAAPGVTPASGPFAANSVAPGYQACHWTLGNQPVELAAIGNAAGNLPMLAFQVAVDIGAPPGTALLNTSFATSTGNLTFLPTYQGATKGFQCSAGQVCNFSNWTLSISATSGIVLSKQVSRGIVGLNTGFEYVLNYAAIGTVLDNLRVLDVLPATTDARTSAFSGTLQLAGPIPLPVAEAGPPVGSADAAMVVLYTSNAPANIKRNPYDAGHNLSGTGGNSTTATNWCTAAQFGSAGCPSGWPAVTAFMALPKANAGGTVPANTSYRLHVPVLPTDNVVGNVYLNDFVADSPSLQARVAGSNTVSTTVVAPDLVISKTASPAAIQHGASTVFTLTVRNNTGSGVSAIEDVPGTSIAMVDLLPTGMQAQLPVTAADWDCSTSTAARIECVYTGSLPVLAGAQLGADILVTATGKTPGSMVNSAAVAMKGQAEAPTTNNTASATVTVNPVTGLTVSGRVYRENSAPANTVDDGAAVDPGIANVKVRLVCNNPAYDQSVTTAADGSYSFANVTSAAQCTITQTAVSGYTNTYNTLGNGATGSTGATGTDDSTMALVVPPTGSSGNNFAKAAVAAPTPVPVLGWPALMALSALLGMFGVSVRRRAAG